MKKVKAKKAKKKQSAATAAAITLAAARWAKPGADRNQPARAGILGGRPKKPTQCKRCGVMCDSTNEARAHKCGGK